MKLPPPDRSRRHRGCGRRACTSRAIAGNPGWRRRHRRRPPMRRSAGLGGEGPDADARGPQEPGAGFEAGQAAAVLADDPGAGALVDRPGFSDRGVPSPTVGIVVEVHAFPGDTVRTGDRLFTSAALQRVPAEHAVGAVQVDARDGAGHGAEGTAGEGGEERGRPRGPRDRAGEPVAPADGVDLRRIARTC